MDLRKGIEELKSELEKALFNTSAVKKEATVLVDPPAPPNENIEGCPGAAPKRMVKIVSEGMLFKEAKEIEVARHPYYIAVMAKNRNLIMCT